MLDIRNDFARAPKVLPNWLDGAGPVAAPFTHSRPTVTGGSIWAWINAGSPSTAQGGVTIAGTIGILNYHQVPWVYMIGSDGNLWLNWKAGWYDLGTVSRLSVLTYTCSVTTTRPPVRLELVRRCTSMRLWSIVGTRSRTGRLKSTSRWAPLAHDAHWQRLDTTTLGCHRQEALAH